MKEIKFFDFLYVLFVLYGLKKYIFVKVIHFGLRYKLDSIIFSYTIFLFKDISNLSFILVLLYYFNLISCRKQYFLLSLLKKSGAFTSKGDTKMITRKDVFFCHDNVKICLKPV